MQSKDYCRSPNSLDEWQVQDARENHLEMQVDRAPVASTLLRDRQAQKQVLDTLDCDPGKDEPMPYPPVAKPFGKVIEWTDGMWLCVWSDAWNRIRSQGPGPQSMCEQSLRSVIKEATNEYYQYGGT